MTRLSKTAKRRRTGINLMLVFLVGWAVTQFSIQMYIGYQNGYGTGFEGKERIPPEIAEKYKVETNVEAARATLDRNTTDTWLINGEGFVPDTIRIVFTLLLMAANIFFWYSVISRVGTF